MRKYSTPNVVAGCTFLMDRSGLLGGVASAVATTNPVAITNPASSRFLRTWHMPQSEAGERIAGVARNPTTGSIGSKQTTGRLRAVAAALEKVAIFIAMALLTYALIVVDSRAAIPRLPEVNVSGWSESTRTFYEGSGEAPNVGKAKEALKKMAP